MKDEWNVTKKATSIELRQTFISTGSRYAQVLIKISAAGIPPVTRSARLAGGVVPAAADPNVVISMNGTAGLSFTEWGKMHAAINEGIASAVRLNVSAILGNSDDNDEK